MVMCVAHDNEKVHEGSSHLLHDSNVLDVDEYRTRPSARNFRRCASIAREQERRILYRKSPSQRRGEKIARRRGFCNPGEIALLS